MDVEDIYLVHPEKHINNIFSLIPNSGLKGVEKEPYADTFLCPNSKNAILRSCGAGTAAADKIIGDNKKRIFCAVRPPGHHAETVRANGFCFVNNVAVTARYLQSKYEINKIAIIDFDVHHGNGTQELLYDEGRALLIASQQMPLWPGSGGIDETGVFDTVVNMPLAPGSGGVAMRRAYEAQAFPRLEAFRPELIIVSAGFDAHRADPLAGLNWSTDDFRWLTMRLCALADGLCNGRVVSTLEGGYDLQALQDSTKRHVDALIEFD